MSHWPSNYVKVVCHPLRFELHPKRGELPEVIATTQRLQIAVDWDDNVIPDSGGKRKWKRIVIRNFKLVEPPAELPQYALPNDEVIEDRDYNPVECRFGGFPSKIDRLVVAFDIDYVPYSGPQDTCTLDPVVIIRPDP